MSYKKKGMHEMSSVDSKYSWDELSAQKKKKKKSGVMRNQDLCVEDFMELNSEEKNIIMR